MASVQDLFASDHTRCSLRSNVFVVTFDAPRPRVSADVLRAIERALDEAERRRLALVIASASENFAFGADLDDALAAAVDNRPQVLDAALREYQRVMLRLRYASVPIVAAVRGTAVSGGCELLMHCARVVAHRDSRIGLMESAAGVVPSGGGLKEFARRAAQSENLEKSIARAFEVVCAARIGRSAIEAQQLGFLTSFDRLDATEPLEEAVELARELQADGYAPPHVDSFRVGGLPLFQKLREAEQRKLDAGELTPHQFEINSRIAHILCGGDAPAGTRTEAELLELERMHFLVLAPMPLSQARISHLRSTGRPLAN